MVEPIYCVHCGAVAKHPVTKTINGQTLNFCCGGCLQVYEMLQEEGLAPAPQPPVKASAPGRTLTFAVGGMTCANCTQTVSRRLRAVPGVQSAEVQLATGQATVQIDPAVTPAALKQAVEAAGYTAVIPGAA
jgi:copper chaperone CopZ